MVQGAAEEEKTLAGLTIIITVAALPGVEVVDEPFNILHEFTCYTDFVAETQNITLSLPRELLRRVKRLAADRDTSVSALMTEALARVADEDRRYSAARKRALEALSSARSLGINGRITWSRDELHER